MKKHYFIIVVITMMAACKMPEQTTGFTHKTYSVPTGPEDFVLDTITGKPRLIISCGIKRKKDTTKGDIVVLDIASQKITPIAIKGLPDNLEFFPHGVDLAFQNDSLILLVVNHEQTKKGVGRNSILRFLVNQDELLFIQKIASIEMKNPNAVCGLKDGSFFFSNMVTKSMLSKGNVTYCKDGNCNVVSRKIRYANGVAFYKDKLYVASTLEKKIYSYDFASKELTNEAIVAELKGGDNLRVVNDVLYCAAHFNIMKFIGHVGKSSNHSPTAIFTKNLNTGKEDLIFFNDGTVIDASSTALEYNGKLYITGVFDPEVVEITLKK